MKVRELISVIIFGTLLGAASAASLEDAFVNPPDSAKPWVYWINMDVEREVKRRLELFPKGGLFLGPTHAIQVGSPLENILALYRAAGSLCENIDDSILSIKEDSGDVDKINMSKLY